MLNRISWEEFLSSGVLLFINQFLHIFGLCIVYNIDETGNVTDVYPAKTTYRGFSEEDIDKSYKNITTYVQNNIETLVDDVEE